MNTGDKIKYLCFPGIIVASSFDEKEVDIFAKLGRGFFNR